MKRGATRHVCCVQHRYSCRLSSTVGSYTMVGMFITNICSANSAIERIIEVRTHKEAEDSVAHLREAKLLGWATKRVPSLPGQGKKGGLRIAVDDAPRYGGLSTAFRDFPSILQLASGDACVLFRLHLLEKLPACLQAILEDKQVIKVGMNVLHDVQQLQRYEFEKHGNELWAQSLIELPHLIATINPFPSTSSSGTRSIYELVSMVATKDEALPSSERKLELTDWEAEQLTHDQLRHAALMAWWSREILRRLNAQKELRQSVLDYIRQQCNIAGDDSYFS